MARKISILVLVIIAIILSALTIIYWGKIDPLAGFKSRHVALAYYNNLAKGDFDAAFKEVGYFEEASDLEPKITYEDAKKIWVNRLNSLKAKGTYLKKVVYISVHMDDGYPKGLAKVMVVENGEQKTWEEQIHFGRLNGKWKIQAVSKSVGDLEEPLYNRARFGYIPHSLKAVEIENIIAKLKSKQVVNIGKFKLSQEPTDVGSIHVFTDSNQEQDMINRQYIEMELNEFKNDFAVLRLSYPELDKFLGTKKVSLKLIIGNRIFDYQNFMETIIEKGAPVPCR